MGNRLSKIYTRTGDDGTTGLGDGSRTSKDDLRVEAFGTVDELNSLIGQVISCGIEKQLAEQLYGIQQQLFDLGGELCIPGTTAIEEAAVTALEQQLDELNESLGPLKNFILPGGSPAAATCHVARTVCRRAERRIISLSNREQVNPASTRYLNRLSDLLFVMARTINHRDDHPETLWNAERNS